MPKKIPPGFIMPSAAFCVPKSRIKQSAALARPPKAGDLAYGEVVALGQHASIENRHGRIHDVGEGTKAVFVFGNRYAPDYYEAVVPDGWMREVDMVARSAIVGQVRAKQALIKEPTKIRLQGYVVGDDGEPLNTRQFRRIAPKEGPKAPNRARMLLFVGTSMNAGKSTAAARAVWALTAMGHEVRASKVTGTASLKDILLFEDSGAKPVSDFSYLGHPSTYLLDEAEVVSVFNSLDLKFGNNPRRFWVVELADGILQRETAMLLRSEDVRSRIHRLVFCAGDALGAAGGVRILEEQFGLKADAVSGICSSSPLALRELAGLCDCPVLDSTSRALGPWSVLI